MSPTPLETFESKFGLPPIQQVSSLVAGPTAKRLDSILGRLEPITRYLLVTTSY